MGNFLQNAGRIAKDVITNPIVSPMGYATSKIAPAVANAGKAIGKGVGDFMSGKASYQAHAKPGYTYMRGRQVPMKAPVAAKKADMAQKMASPVPNYGLKKGQSIGSPVPTRKPFRGGRRYR